MKLLPISILLVAVSLAGYVNGQQPAVDGVFNEWQTGTKVATDGTGDATGAFDVSTVSAISSGSVLHLHFDIGQPINLQNGSDDEGTLQLILGAKEKQLTIDFRARTVTDGTAEHIGWDKVGFQCLPTYASDKYEMRIDVADLDVKPGDTVSLQFAGSDSLDRAAAIVVQEAEPVPATPQGWAKTDGTFRVVNQNTLSSGLANADRGPKFKRLFAAINADVYCFQEEWKEELFNTGAASTLGSMTVHWNSACAIASRHKLVGLPMVLDRAAAGLITVEDGSKVVVVSAHFKCCGFAGSKEDGLRIQQAEQLVGEIKRMREGAFGEEAKNAPVVLIGDYNLVGSRKPLDIINAAGLTDVICRATDGTAHTWRGLKADESFWPGRLDLVAHDPRLNVIKSNILDSNRLTAESLKAFGLEAEDSLASDHLMLVCDFESAKPLFTNWEIFKGKQQNCFEPFVELFGPHSSQRGWVENYCEFDQYQEERHFEIGRGGSGFIVSRVRVLGHGRVDWPFKDSFRGEDVEKKSIKVYSCEFDLWVSPDLRKTEIPYTALRLLDGIAFTKSKYRDVDEQIVNFAQTGSYIFRVDGHQANLKIVAEAEERPPKPNWLLVRVKIFR